VTPPPVRYAGYLVTAEGALAIVVALFYLIHAATGANQDVVRGTSAAAGFSYGTAAWFTIVGAAVVAAGWALTQGRRWGRGVAVFANLLLLGVAWYIYSAGELGYAVLVAAAALVALGLLFSPSAVHWMTTRDAE
jgi:hypothetical protein